MKGVSVGMRAVLALSAVLVACGGSSSSGKPQPSGLLHRALVTNAFGGATLTLGNVEIVDATKDLLSTHTITAGSEPGLMAVSPGREITLVFDTASNQVSVINNSTEQSGSAIQLPDFTESLIAKDANTGFATVRNASVAGQSDLGAVVVLDLANTKVSDTVGVPRARRMVMNHAGTKLLVFSDHYAAACGGTTALTVIDIGSKAPTPVCGFDQAAGGVFSSDDNTAYIMNCGPECGGATAGVALLDMNALAVTNSVPLPGAGATVGLLNGTNLYVAGTVGGAAGAGTLSVLNVGGTTPTVSSPVHISDGFHTRMALGSNNKLFIGSVSCTNDPSSGTPTGCLTIFDISANSAVIDKAKGSVTGMAPIVNRNIVYVIEGGELRIYDTTTSAESTQHTIDIVGQAVDVKAVDQPQ